MSEQSVNAELVARYSETIDRLQAEFGSITDLLRQVRAAHPCLAKRYSERIGEYLTCKSLMLNLLNSERMELAEFPYINLKFLEIFKQQMHEIGLACTGEEYATLRGIDMAIARMTPMQPEYVDTRFCGNGPLVSDGVTLKKCFKCPSCGRHIFYDFPDKRCCPYCGQLLLWNVDDAKEESDGSVVVELPIRLTFLDWLAMISYPTSGCLPNPFCPMEVVKYVKYLEPYMTRYFNAEPPEVLVRPEDLDPVDLDVLLASLQHKNASAPEEDSSDEEVSSDE